MDIKGRVAFITGGASGIGLATAKKLLKEGANVVIFSKNVSGIEKDFPRDKALLIDGDVRVRDVVNKAVKQTIDKFGSLDILVNNAGVAKDGSFIKSTEEDWDFMWSINVKGVFLVTQEALRVMGEGENKVIINIASGAGIHGIGDLAAYSVTKAAIINFTQSLNEELKDKIRVITVAPGSTDTKMFHSLWPNKKARHTPEQVADVIYKTITGEILPDEHFIVDVFYHTR